MNDRNLCRGLFLAAFSLVFGLNSFRYTIGHFAHAGPGLFPLIVSSLLLVIAVITIVRSRFMERMPLEINYKNIGLVMLSLCGFALVSHFLDMAAGIAFMVFTSAFAGSTRYSVPRNLKIAAGLIAVAFAFQQLLGLSLPLF